ncbi:hypothetical protein MANES_09G110500v8 [Manihot esculenta]|uniref:Uncharacterized protein n=1 Tax=Manihot esculenta TaxID=3983 RepID=A0A2C9V9S0_MANES|nr:hypothetical protein MANES_09G110500v8 [Manihot esculenta]
MGRWKAWLCFEQTFHFSAKRILLKLTSNLRPKARGNNQGLMNLYKDMESCGGYTDIQVMWEIIHSSSPPNGYCARRKRTYWKFCFRPT